MDWLSHFNNLLLINPGCWAMILDYPENRRNNQIPNTKHQKNLKSQSIGLIFIFRGAGYKPEWRISPKIGLLMFTPHLLIPLPQGAELYP
jgi:hypothetical protein